MNTLENRNDKDQYNHNYINDIQDDWKVFKALTILALVVFMALVAFFIF